MFSYRHAFHAGNHADVLKHLILIECINHLLKKDVGITFIDTHAGAGIYQIDQGYATVSKESEAGIKRLRQFADTHPVNSHAILDYLKTIQKFNEDSELSIYPGSPALIGKKLRPQDNLKLTASGMFIINPPWKLNETLQEALPELVEALENSPGSGGFKLNHFTP